MNEMTTPTDLAQALRESITNSAWITRIRSDYPEDTVDMGDETVREEYADGWKYADTWDHLGDAREDYERLADAYLELFEAHESRAQPASVDEIAMHLACEHGDTDDAATGYSFTMEQFDAFVHAFVRAIRSDLPAQPASVADGWVTVPRQPTESMINAAARAETKHVIAERKLGGSDFQIGWGSIWTAMLAAAPQPPAKENE